MSAAGQGVRAADGRIADDVAAGIDGVVDLVEDEPGGSSQGREADRGAAIVTSARPAQSSDVQRALGASMGPLLVRPVATPSSRGLRAVRAQAACHLGTTALAVTQRMREPDQVGVMIAHLRQPRTRELVVGLHPCAPTGRPCSGTTWKPISRAAARGDDGIGILPGGGGVRDVPAGEAILHLGHHAAQLSFPVVGIGATRASQKAAARAAIPTTVVRRDRRLIGLLMCTPVADDSSARVARAGSQRDAKHRAGSVPALC